MKDYNILTGQLFTDLDTPYDKENNKIDVYSSVYWTADSNKEYTEKETIIHEYKVENNLCTINAWCDISGYDYWVVRQEEENYVSIDVVLLKPAEDYTKEEMIKLRDLITEADDYFQKELL
tara:strand:+ start:335 stop:697 length:363 start_codon:yes stop_codon:yes gene_type:complete